MTLTFLYEKVKMNVFLQSLESRVAKVVTKSFSAPNGDEDMWSKIVPEDLMLMLGHTIHYFKPLNDDDIARLINCKFAYEIWSHLVVTYEGTS